MYSFVQFFYSFTVLTPFFYTLFLQFCDAFKEYKKGKPGSNGLNELFNMNYRGVYTIVSNT